MSWSSVWLKPGYSRCLIGFDFRERLVAHGKIPATLDPEVWRRVSIQHSAPDENGFNLYDVTPENALLSENATLVAFDIPQSLAALLASSFGVVALPIQSASADLGWTFLGYDVVDVRTQSSGFYSFQWTNVERDDLLRRLASPLNPFGLLDSELSAINASRVFDALVKEHAPFAPCGVSVKRVSEP